MGIDSGPSQADRHFRADAQSEFGLPQVDPNDPATAQRAQEIHSMDARVRAETEGMSIGEVRQLLQTEDSAIEQELLGGGQESADRVQRQLRSDHVRALRKVLRERLQSEGQ